MDRTVPAGAAILLDFIRQTEVGRQDRASHDVIYGHKQEKLPKPLTSMTIDEVIKAQPGRSKNHGFSAAGGYQFVRNTLIDLKEELGLRRSQVLDANCKTGSLITCSSAGFMAGTLNRTEFGSGWRWPRYPPATTVRWWRLPTSGQ